MSASHHATFSRTAGSARRLRRGLAEINMVPFIDVMLVLLIIFMVTAPLITPSTIDLPSVGKANQRADVVLSIEIQADGQRMQLKFDSLSLWANTTASLVAEVQKALKGRPQAAVVISADKSVKYERVIAVMDALQKAGIQRLGLSVQLAPAPSMLPPN